MADERHRIALWGVSGSKRWYSLHGTRMSTTPPSFATCLDILSRDDNPLGPLVSWRPAAWAPSNSVILRVVLDPDEFRGREHEIQIVILVHLPLADEVPLRVVDVHALAAHDRWHIGNGVGRCMVPKRSPPSR